MNEAMVEKGLQTSLGFGQLVANAPSASVAVGDLDYLVIWIRHYAFKNFPDVYNDVSLSPSL